MSSWEERATHELAPWGATPEQIDAAAKAIEEAVLQEREACAKTAEAFHVDHVAAFIRARTAFDGRMPEAGR